MSAYADMASVRTILNLDAPTAAQQARLDALDLAISDLMNRQLGRSYDALPPADQTRTRPGRNVSPVLPLDYALRTVSAIAVDGVTLDPSRYRLRAVDRDGNAWAVETTDGSFWAAADAIAITGVWADQPYQPAPEAVIEAVTLLVAASFKADEAGPTGVVGPDGIPVQTRDPWKDARVVNAIETYRLAPVVL